MTKKQEKKKSAQAADETKKTESINTTDETKVEKFTDPIPPVPPAPKDDEADTSKEPFTQMSYDEAKKLLETGGLIKLPDWQGFWFADIDNPEQVYVLTKEGEVLDNPMEEYKESNEWTVAEPTPEQSQIISDFWFKKEQDEEAAKIQKDLEDEYNESISRKAVLYNMAFDGSFSKVEHNVTLKDLQSRKKSIKDAVEIVLEDGSIFNAITLSVTNKKHIL